MTNEAFVVGVGMHPYRQPSQAAYTEMGLTAIRAALADAGLGWTRVDSAYVGTALVGAAAGGPMLRHLGSSPLSIAQVENASASGSTAFRSAVLDVLVGAADVSLAVGVDKPAMRPDGYQASGMAGLADGLVSPVTHFAMLAEQYLRETGATREQLAAVAVKNHRNGERNPYAQRRELVSVEEVLAAPAIAGALTKYQCCPVGEGAAAVLVASGDAVRRLGIDRSRAVRVAASVSRSEEWYAEGLFPDAELTRRTTVRALSEAGVGPDDLDVVEVHDAFSIEEVVYLEAIGLSEPGRAAADVQAGKFDIGAECAVSPSGGLLSMGHPVGPTGVGQISEITMQLRGEAGDRQQPHARVGLAHMLGIGTVCVEHVLIRDSA